MQQKCDLRVTRWLCYSIKVTLSVITYEISLSHILVILWSQVKSFSHWLRFVIMPILSTMITTWTVKSLLITTYFFSVITPWSRSKVVTLWSHIVIMPVITPWSGLYRCFFCDHSVVTGQKYLPRDHTRDQTSITPLFWLGRSFGKNQRGGGFSIFPSKLRSPQECYWTI